MSKIPFTLDAWLKDKSQKIETAFGEPAKIVFTEGLGEHPILAVIYDGDTTDSAWFTKDGKSYDGVYGLFIVMPEEEMTDFEKKLWEVLKSEGSPIGPIEKFTNADKEVFHSYAAKLLSLAREQFIKDGYVIEKKAFHDAVEKVDSGMIKEVSAHIDFENLIHNLGKRYPEVSFAKLARIAKVAYQKGGEEALKDLPRWKKWGNGACGNSIGIPIAIVKRGLGDYKLVDSLGIQDEQYIMLSDIEKLPGFKED